MNAPKANSLPEEILKACLTLGIDPQDLQDDVIRAAWKRQVSAMARIGDFESATHLRSIKDTLINWIRSNRFWFTPPRAINLDATNLGGNWPPLPEGPDAASGVPRRPHPTLGSGDIAMPEPGLDA
jgi:hypothetical protein